jgi:hypothetical protein
MNHQSLFQLRFEHHPQRHPNLTWEQVASSLSQEQWRIMEYMEDTVVENPMWWRLISKF